MSITSFYDKDGEKISIGCRYVGNTGNLFILLFDSETLHEPCFLRLSDREKHNGVEFIEFGKEGPFLDIKRDFLQ